jgi:hypothetical protein
MLNQPKINVGNIRSAERVVIIGTEKHEIVVWICLSWRWDKCKHISIGSIAIEIMKLEEKLYAFSEEQ